METLDYTGKSLPDLGEVIQGSAYLTGVFSGFEDSEKQLRDLSGTYFALGKDEAARLMRDAADRLKSASADKRRILAESSQQRSKAAFQELDRVQQSKLLLPHQVEWIVNDFAELGVKIGDQVFFLYKGNSISYATHDDKTPLKWRLVEKREFGESVRPQSITHFSYEDRYTDGEDWQDVLPQIEYNKQD